MSGRSSKYTRRDFLGQTLGAGVGMSVRPLLTVAPDVLAAAVPQSQRPIVLRDEGSMRIHVQQPAGPPPLGAPVETSIPFARGRVQNTEDWVVFSPAGKAMLTQTRPGMWWPDGSVRWLLVLFEADEGPGVYVLRKSEAVRGKEMVREEQGRLVMNSGEVELRMAASGPGWIEQIAVPGPDGSMRAIVEGTGAGDLVLTRHDGLQFRASRGGDSRKVTVEERGPVRASVRVDGACRAQDGSEFFSYIARWTMYHGRAETHLQLTWINATDNLSEQVRDIRLEFPYRFLGKRLVFGCAQGVFDEPFLRDWPLYLLQEDYNWYWARVHNPDGRVQNLSSGGCNGEHCPGWLYLEGEESCLGLWVPRFWEEYPNEIALKDGMLSVGLWPERAMTHLLSKPILPANPDGKQRYIKTDYTPVMPHPYIAFVDEEQKCLDAVQGLAKTQDIVLSAWAGKGEHPSFETKWWRGSLQPVRGHLDPEYVATTGVLGELWPVDPERFPEFERLFQECFGWLDGSIDTLKCYGKFDFGDWKYFTAATDYYCGPGTKWGELGEMPREGYWQNNERDQLLGLLLYYYRTGNPAAWERVKIVARHLFDVDIKHHADWGMWTHSYGHCYVATAPAGEPDHSWLWGALVWCGISGDSAANQWMTKCMKGLLRQKIDFEKVDARTGSVYLHMMCKFYEYTGEKEYLDAAAAPAHAFLKLQNANGSWPAYMGDLKSPQIEGFVEHVIMAMANYYALTKKDELIEPLNRAIRYTFGERGEILGNIGEAPLAVYGLSTMASETGNKKYRDIATDVLMALRDAQKKGDHPGSIGEGDYWAEWGVNNPKAAEGTGRPPQFLGETRPLSPGCVLAYAQQVLASLAGEDAKPCEATTPRCLNS